ncbi:hypothetical protein CRE_22468 [Caenorhabditis remanei]|uniref:Zinc finger PHD-type domain-containing protein n=1 Tax=Caenorhabditis remanei TaxID=31234 RepID=E3MED6_CAERE|nr:hypothetical protein CRE_22468 [Caenorhabditis remanei]
MHHFNRQPSNTPANANARVTGQPARRSQSAFVPTPSLQAILNQADTLAQFQQLAALPNYGAQVQAQMGVLPNHRTQFPAQVGSFPNLTAQVPAQMGAPQMRYLPNFGGQVPIQMGALPNHGAQAPAQLGAPQMGALPNFGAQVQAQMGAPQMRVFQNYGTQVLDQLGASQLRALSNSRAQVQAQMGAQVPAQVRALPNLGAQVPDQMRAPQMGAFPNFGAQVQAQMEALLNNGGHVQAQIGAPQVGANPMALPLAVLAQWMSLQQAAEFLGNRWMIPYIPVFHAPGVVPQAPAEQIPEAREDTNGNAELNENSQTPATISMSPETRPVTTELTLPHGIVQPTKNVTVSRTSATASAITGASYSSYLEDYEFESEEEEEVDKDEPCCSSSLRSYSDQPSTSDAQNSRKRVQVREEDKKNSKKTTKSKKEKKPTKPDETEIKIEDEEEGNETEPQVVLPRRNVNEPTQAELERIDPEILGVCQASHCILHEILPRLPKDDDVQWVQCDNRQCNKWFHSVCVRMTNSKFRDTTAFFCCGKQQTQHGKNAMSGAIYRRWKRTLAREGLSCRSEMLKEEARRKKK